MPFSGRTVTFSFYARIGALYSGTSATTASLFYGTGTDQNLYSSGFTGQVNALSIVPGGSGQPALSTSWQRYSASVAIPTTSTQLGIQFIARGTGTAGATDYIDITGLQIEIASQATAFSRAGGSIGGELALCQRYLPAFYPPSSAGADFFLGYAYGTNTSLYFCNFDVPARVPPTGITATGTFNAAALNAFTTVTPSFNSASQFSGSILTTQTITGGQGTRMTMSAGALLLFTGCEL